MKKKIAILGSTGSIGKILLEIIKKNKKIYQIIVLTANKDYKTLYAQAKKFGVRNLIITNDISSLLNLFLYFLFSCCCFSNIYQFYCTSHQ